VTYAAMMKGIEVVTPRRDHGRYRPRDPDLCESFGYSVVREYCGHGLGQDFPHRAEHSAFWQTRQGVRLEEGMFFTVEPMVNVGKAPTILNKA
jgi:methionyl aminopeptidase